ncbi:MAG: hypothetical protein KDJ14_02620 [Xanthomonadales bacterium]|nr:hypothetical protein [Xanthomonadales bacterium]
MGLLDDLEKEAAQQREQEARQAFDREIREHNWQASLEPAMQALAAYLKQLTETLSFLKRRIRMTYQIGAYGEVVAYVDPSFTFRQEPGKGSMELVLEYVAQVAPEECPAVQADTMARVKSLQSVLQQHTLGGMSDPRKNANGDVVSARFQARGKIPIVIHVAASIDSGVAKISFTNLEGFGQSHRTFSPDQLNAKLFDALGRFITREELRFAQESVPDDVRRQLQAKIQRDQMRRDWEGKLSRQLGDDEAKVIDSLDPAARPSLLLGKLRLLSVKFFGR